MKDQVLMAPNGQLVIGIPLFRRHYAEDQTFEMPGFEAKHTFEVVLTSDKPIAYAVDCGPEVNQIALFSAEFVELNFEFLGDA